VTDIFRDWVVDSQIARIPVKQRNLSKKDLIGLISVQLRQFQSVKITPDIQKVFESFESKDEYFALNCTAIADRGAPLDGVLPPVITSAKHISWTRVYSLRVNAPRHPVQELIVHLIEKMTKVTICQLYLG